MKKINIFYWICTGNLIPGLGIGSIYGIILHPGSTEQFVRLGYPVYLAPFLGVAKILGLIVIVIPKYPRLKEWAYAGLAFDMIGAFYSQIATGQPFTSSYFLSRQYSCWAVLIFFIIVGFGKPRLSRQFTICSKD